MPAPNPRGYSPRFPAGTPAWFARPIAPRCSGANRADWVGRGALGGVLYDLTTNNPAEIAKHLARFYGERMRVVTYVPPW